MHIEQTLSKAGHATIRNMAARAIADRDEVAGAAILAVLDKMPAEERPVSTEELASRVLGERHTTVTQSMAMVTRAERERQLEDLENLNFSHSSRLAGAEDTDSGRSTLVSAWKDGVERLSACRARRLTRRAPGCLSSTTPTSS